jgi:hypothetical protein
VREEQHRQTIAKECMAFCKNLKKKGLEGSIDTLHFELDLNYGVSLGRVKEKIRQIEKLGLITVEGDRIIPKKKDD